MAPNSISDNDKQLTAMISAYLSTQGYSKAAKYLCKEFKKMHNSELDSIVADGNIGDIYAAHLESVKNDASSEVSSSSSSDSSESSESESEIEKVAEPVKADIVVEKPAPVAEEKEEEDTAADKKQKKRRGDNPNGERFKRVKEEEVEFLDDRLKDNTFLSKPGSFNSYGFKAHQDLIVTKGKGFLKAKNKKKRGSYSGGQIDVYGSHSVKFD